MSDVRVKVGADLSEYQRKMQSLGGIAKTAMAGLAGIVGGLSFARAISAVNSLKNELDNIGKGAVRLSVTTAEFQELSYAARIAGSDIGQIETAFRTMSQKVFDAKRGLETAKQELAGLGLTLADLDGKSRLEQFKIVATAIKGVGDEGDQAALALRFFGRAGQQLLPLIGQMGELSEEFQALGATIDESAVKAAENLNDSMTRLGTSMKAIVAGSGMIEYLADLAKAIEEVQAAANLLKKQGIETTQPSGGAGRKASRALLKWAFLTPDFVADKLGMGKNVLSSAAEELMFGTAGYGLKTTAPRDTGELGTAITQLTAREQAAAERAKIATAANVDKYLRDEFAGVDKARDKAFESRETAEARALEAVKKQVLAMREQLIVQRLLNMGREKEAAIVEQLQAMENAAGRALTDRERAAGARMAGALFEARQKQKGGTLQEVGVNIISDSLLRMGGRIGGGAVRQVTGNLDVRRNDLLGEIRDNTKPIKDINWNMR